MLSIELKQLVGNIPTLSLFKDDKLKWCSAEMQDIQFSNSQILKTSKVSFVNIWLKSDENDLLIEFYEALYTEHYY